MMHPDDIPQLPSVPSSRDEYMQGVWTPEPIRCDGCSRTADCTCVPCTNGPDRFCTACCAITAQVSA